MNSTQNTSVRKLRRSLVIAVIVCATILIVAYASKPAEKDYISYWSAGQLLAKHGNPYSASQVLLTERSQGYAPSQPLIMRNPPTSLFLTVPLGWVTPRIGLLFWMAATLGCIAWTLDALGVAAQDRMLAYFFAPVIACFVVGQSSAFLLLGLALFLHFQDSVPLAAAAGLLLMATKPHLFLTLWPILFIDCLYRRRYLLMAGGAAAISGAALLIMWIDPQVWSQYLSMLRTAGIGAEFIPTPAGLLRYLAAPGIVWLQFLPVCASIAWGIWFYLLNRSSWNWQQHGMPLLLVSVLASPYAWTTDEIVLLPAMMAALANPAKPKHAVYGFAAINGIVIIMLMAQAQMTSGAYVWTSSAWLAWYFYASRRRTMDADGVGELNSDRHRQSV